MTNKVLMTIGSKEMKNALNKIAASVPKKFVLSIMENVLFDVTRNDVRITGNNMDDSLTYIVKNVYDLVPGKFVMSMESFKRISELKESSEIISDIQEKTLIVKNGKKRLKFTNNYNPEDFFTVSKESLENMETIWKTTNLDFLKTLEKLSTNLGMNDNRKLMTCYNFDCKHKRIVTLDGHRFALRNVPEMESDRLVNLYYTVFPKLKKILNDKANYDSELTISSNGKYIKIQGSDFEYISKEIEGDYFRIDSMLTNDFDKTIKVYREEMLEIMKYNKKLKTDTIPVVIANYDKTIYSYFNTATCENLDIVESEMNTISNDFEIGFDPNYLVDAFENVSENDLVTINFTNPKSPTFIHDDSKEYLFVVLSVNINKAKDYKEKILKLA